MSKSTEEGEHQNVYEGEGGGVKSSTENSTKKYLLNPSHFFIELFPSLNEYLALDNCVHKNYCSVSNNDGSIGKRHFLKFIKIKQSDSTQQ